MQVISYTHHSPPEFFLQLDDLMQETFGFTFAAWQQTGAWGADYTCHAIVKAGRILSSACAYRMDLRISGQPLEAWQIGAVATRKERRGEGLSRLVLQSILDLHPGGAFFLCANPGVLSYYPRFGFHAVRQRQPLLRLRPPELRRHPPLPLNPPQPGGQRKLPGSEFATTALAYFRRRACYSRIFDCANAAPVNLFNLLYNYADAAYEIPELEALVIAEQQGSTLNLIDVCAARPLTLAELLLYLDFPGTETLRFGFNPDWLAVDYELDDYEEDGALFFRGPLEISEDFLLPFLIKT